MKYKLLLLLAIIGMVSASDSCTRPYNRIGNLCCPDYNNDMICDLHPTSTTIPPILIINDTYIFDTLSNSSINVGKEKIEKITNNNSMEVDNKLAYNIIKPKLKTTTSTRTTTTINIKTGSKSSSSTIKKLTTTTQKIYKSADRVTPMPTQENYLEKNKYYVAGGIISAIAIIILFLYIIGNESDE